jgi:hypothetical protein
MNHRSVVLAWVLVLAAIGANVPQVMADDPTAPALPVKLIFIHHSTGGYWLASSATSDLGGDLGQALMDNNYFVSATNYGWGPNQIGSSTDIPNWPDWFTGPDRDTIMAAVYSENNQNICNPSSPGDDCFGDWPRLSTDPGGENEIVMFKSCFPNSDLYTDPADGFTVTDAQNVYNDILTYFATRQDKLFIVITAPPLQASETAPDRAANARTFNNWLVNDWLAGYSHSNVAVFDYYNVLTSNGSPGRIDDPLVTTEPNDYALRPDGNHHYWNGVQATHTQTVANNFSAYPSGDSHPTSAGHQKATYEFAPLLNVFYHRWKSGANTLTVTKSGTGAGRVTSNPTGIDCGSACMYSLFPSTTVVTLTASASAGSAFTGWSGGGCTGTASCTVTMNQARNVTATFAADPTAHTLTVSVVGSSGGSVISTPSGIACPPACTAGFAGGAAVALAATAEPGGTFRVWRGACTTVPCSVTMNANKAVTAVFSKTFTDDPLTSHVTLIKEVHVADLRAAINTLRSRHSLVAYPWTDPTLIAGFTQVKAVHLLNLRNALNDVGPTTYAETITAGTTPIKASHLTELRDRVRALE